MQAKIPSCSCTTGFGLLEESLKLQNFLAFWSVEVAEVPWEMKSPIVILEIGTGEWILGSFYLKLVTFGVCGIKSTEDCCLVVWYFYPEILIPGFLYQPHITSFKASLHTWVSCCLAGGLWRPGAWSGQRWGFAASAGGAFRREAANNRILGSEYDSLESWNKLISWVKCFISVVSPLCSICCLKRQVLCVEESESFTVCVWAAAKEKQNQCEKGATLSQGVVRLWLNNKLQAALGF